VPTKASNVDVSSKLSGALPMFLLVLVGLGFHLADFGVPHPGADHDRAAELRLGSLRRAAVGPGRAPTRP
jgi:hypothetical protein